MEVVEIPIELLEQADQAVTQLRQSVENAGLVWPTDAIFKHHLLVLFSSSIYAVRFSIRFPEILFSKSAQSSLSQPCTLQEYREKIGAVFDIRQSEDQLMRSLRILRQQEMIRISWRDINHLAETSETLLNLSELAEAFIDLTLQYCYCLCCERFGIPLSAEGIEQKPLVLGMGKLGGNELNFSSDIDLIFTFSEPGKTTAKKALDISDFYRRVIQQFIHLLNETTEDGFVYRVDLRLRPFGKSGPMAMSFSAMETYYQTQGREWERYAMIKARVVSGSEQAAQQLSLFLRPFVFRRYLDYSAFESLRDLKAKIAMQVKRKGMQNNIKLGAGGIREIEFIGQAFQLVRGGQDAALQQRSIIPILELLGEKKYLATDESHDLLSAYDFLRRTENRLQMVQDQQTHVLPDQAIEQTRLAFAMGYRNWQSFLQVLSRHRQRVQSIFEVVFQSANAESDKNEDIHGFALIWSGELTDEQAQTQLQHAGFGSGVELNTVLKQMGPEGRSYSRLTNLARARLDKLIPMVLMCSCQSDDPDESAKRLLGLLRVIAGRSVYLQVLIEQPKSLDRLVRLLSASKWLTEFVSSYPMVIDELLDHRLTHELPDELTLQNEMQVITQQVSGETLDIQMDAIRQFKQANLMRLVTADLEGLLPIKDISNRLVAIAQVVLKASCDLVWSDLVRKHGRPAMVVNGEIAYPEFAVVAYGKLGGYELGYGSDLDIVFLHDSEGDKQRTDGDKVLENAVFFSRAAQKTVAFLTTHTPAGTLYEIDTRLRPNGKSGLLVSGLQAFAHYQEKKAWTWEHQALVRARVVVGSQRIHNVFASIRKSILCQPRDNKKLRSDVIVMRDHMFQELNKGHDGLFDVKQGRGGIVDIEFMVQYGVLAFAFKHPELIHWTDNIRLLDVLESCGYLAVGQSLKIIDAYFLFRKLTHKQALQGYKSPVITDAQAGLCRAEVKSAWNRLLNI